MAREIGRLSALKVGRLKEPGMYPDGAGLYLQVGGTGTKSWIYRFMLVGRAREMGLGPLHTVPLADARKLAQDARRLRLVALGSRDARSPDHDDGAGPHAARIVEGGRFALDRGEVPLKPRYAVLRIHVPLCARSFSTSCETTHFTGMSPSAAEKQTAF